MPIQRCTLKSGKTGYKWGQHGHCYATRKQAEEQAAAAYAHGYTGDASKERKRSLTSPSGDVVLQPVRPNKGIEVAYRKKMQSMIDDMRRSVIYWMRANYRKYMPSDVVMAQDASAPKELQLAINRLRRQWESNFDDAANQMARWFAQKNKDYSDGSLMGILKNAGFTVDFKMSQEMQTSFTAIVQENVSLIKSIASENLNEVEGLVMRSVTRGRDLGQLTKDLKARFDITDRRAKLIARDQNNKATAVINQTRQKELGITHAIWRHSHAGKHPRPSHVKADGTKFDIEKGLFLDGEWVLPGQAINCLPGHAYIENAAGCKKLWRRWYTGKLTKLITNSGEVIEATPNHPILTRRGWIPINQVDLGDDVFHIGDEIGIVVKDNVDNRYSSIEKIFDLAALYIGSHTSDAIGFKFHGDITDEKIDTVDVESLLPSEFNPQFCKSVCEQFFAFANVKLIEAGFGGDCSLASSLYRLFRAPESVISGFCSLLSLVGTHSAHANDIRLRLASALYSAEVKNSFDKLTTNPVMLGESKFALSGFISGDNFLIGQIFALISRAAILWNGNTHNADFLGQSIFVNSDDEGGFSKSFPGQYKRSSVINKTVIDYFGHVYNLETENNWYSSSNIIYHNCRCTSQSVIPGIDNE